MQHTLQLPSAPRTYASKFAALEAICKRKLRPTPKNSMQVSQVGRPGRKGPNNMISPQIPASDHLPISPINGAQEPPPCRPDMVRALQGCKSPMSDILQILRCAGSIPSLWGPLRVWLSRHLWPNIVLWVIWDFGNIMYRRVVCRAT